MSTKAAFLPLKRKWFDEIKNGTKRVEYRRHKGAFTAKNFYEGRKLKIRLGYSGEEIEAICQRVVVTKEKSIAFMEVYPDHDGEVFEIHFDLVK